MVDSSGNGRGRGRAAAGWAIAPPTPARAPMSSIRTATVRMDVVVIAGVLLVAASRQASPYVLMAIADPYDILADSLRRCADPSALASVEVAARHLELHHAERI